MEQTHELDVLGISVTLTQEDLKTLYDVHELHVNYHGDWENRQKPDVILIQVMPGSGIGADSFFHGTSLYSLSNENVRLLFNAMAKAARKS